MALKIYEFDTVKDMEFFLRGGVTGGRQVVNQFGRVHGLDGLTLIFVSPSGTVTFSDPTGAGLTFAEIADQITTAIGTLSVNWLDGSLHLVLTSPSAAVTVDKDGTANTVFGFSKKKDHAGQVFNGPAGAVPRLVETNNKSRLDGYYAIVEVS